MARSKQTLTITTHWQRFQPQSERAKACGMRNETGSIWLYPRVRKKEVETCRLVLHMSTNNKMLTTTRVLARFPCGQAPEHPSGRLNSIAITLPLPPMKRRRLRFWCLRRRIDYSGVLLETRQNSKSIENCNCLGMPALLGVVNAGIGEFSGP
jgi:hypothetical protein